MDVLSKMLILLTPTVVVRKVAGVSDFSMFEAALYRFMSQIWTGTV
jgi:hypothetical protein